MYMLGLSDSSTAGWASPDPGNPSAIETVAVVITTYNHAHFLRDAIESVRAQTRPADEIIVVDDGSLDDPASVVASYADVHLVRQDNQGLSAARNTGLRRATSDLILFLDADDLLRPRGVESGLTCLRDRPDAGFVYGGHVFIDRKGRRLTRNVYEPIGPSPFKTFLQSNSIGMHATVLYRRGLLLKVGGFDISLKRCEDYDCYFRMARQYPVASHAAVVAEYRMHGANMSGDHREMLRWALLVHDRQRDAAEPDVELHRAWIRGRLGWTDYYGGELLRDGIRKWHSGGMKSAAFRKILSDAREFPRAGFRLLPVLISSMIKKYLIRRMLAKISPSARRRVRAIQWKLLNLLPKAISFGDFTGVKPISDEFGYDRGTPVDRNYIEQFLFKNMADVKGRALEVGDDEYCKRFGGVHVTQQDVLHIHHGNPQATLVGDMSQPGVLPEGVFDVLLLTQTLHLVWDMQAAVKEMHKALKPGGVVLLTVPGISRVDRDEWGSTWYWSLTETSARRLFAEVFGTENVEVEVFGNVYAATAFIQGVALEECDFNKLKVVDSAFPVIVAVRARKPES
ncbi:glycosyltransferase [Phenylobacterium sp.]|jgi:glycosyltransferase involved in cell wall biosynthesis|uniref:glycosyltransferase n=1 Tax=Phenylobacterium sp. TaxID=1871053 RepID=UPI002F3E2119